MQWCWLECSLFLFACLFVDPGPWSRSHEGSTVDGLELLVKVRSGCHGVAEFCFLRLGPVAGVKKNEG